MSINRFETAIRKGLRPKKLMVLLGIGLIASALHFFQTAPHLGKSRKSGFDMVKVQGGTFMMGSLYGDEDERPPHQVTLSGFQIGKYEITQADWRDIMGSDPPELHFKSCDQCPVEMVSWNDAQLFLQKLNARFSGKQYRLPTEAEWEFAARGGNQSGRFEYAGSNDLASVAWVGENSNHQTQPVGGKPANELGLFDMSGNVWELCQDKKRVYSTTPQVNPVGVDKGNVHRGGGWGDDGDGCRNTFRHDGTPDYKGNYLGFRIACPL